MIISRGGGCENNVVKCISRSALIWADEVAQQGGTRVRLTGVGQQASRKTDIGGRSAIGIIMKGEVVGITCC